MDRVRQYLSTYSLFENASSTMHTQRHERTTTRLYYIILIRFTITLVMYAEIIERTKDRTIPVSSKATYEYLRGLETDTLQCPCSELSMSYNNFTVYLYASFHPVCPSDFLSDVWLTYFDQFGGSSVCWLRPRDLRKWGILLDNRTQSLNSLANDTITDVICQLKSSSFISAKAMSSSEIEAQVNGAFELFTRSLQLFWTSDQGSASVSVLGNNWTTIYGSNVSNASVVSVPVTYNNGTCSCVTSSSCLEPAAFHYVTFGQFYIGEGIFLECFLFSTILLSSLPCFHSNSCLDQLKNAMVLGRPNAYIPTLHVNFQPYSVHRLIGFKSVTQSKRSSIIGSSILRQMQHPMNDIAMHAHPHAAPIRFADDWTSSTL